MYGRGSTIEGETRWLAPVIALRLPGSTRVAAVASSVSRLWLIRAMMFWLAKLTASVPCVTLLLTVTIYL